MLNSEGGILIRVVEDKRIMDIKRDLSLYGSEMMSHPLPNSKIARGQVKL